LYRLDLELGLEGSIPPTVPVLWELGLATARPVRSSFIKNVLEKMLLHDVAAHNVNVTELSHTCLKNNIY